MYSEKVMRLLKAAGASEGDMAKVTKGSETFEGLVMPRAEGDANCLVLKLKSGYNIGIDCSGKVDMKLVKKGEAKKAHASGSAPVSKGSLSILGCGGTISSKVEYTTGAVYPSMSESELLAAVPELSSFGKLSARTLFSILSEDLTTDYWKIMAREAEKDIKAGAEGIILTHGTDTLHYSAAALSFMLRTPVPVVFVGSQRSSDRGSSDNVVNLVCAAAAAKSDIAEVSVCMHANSSDDTCSLHRGTRVRKMHTSRRDAFRSVNASPLAQINYKTRKLEHIDSAYSKRGSHKLEVDDKMNSNAALIYTYPGITPKFISSLSNFDGIVFAGTGLGHVPTNAMNNKLATSILPEVKSLIQSGIPVVMAPQTIYGRINMNVYTAGRLLKEAGVIGNGCDWLPEVALVKLMWVLGHTKKMEEVRKLMLENRAGELSARSPTEPDYFE